MCVCIILRILYMLIVMLSHSVLSNSLTLWTAAWQAPLSMGFFRQEYWNSLPCLSPGDLPYPGIEFTSFMSLALAGRFCTPSTTCEAHIYNII